LWRKNNNDQKKTASAGTGAIDAQTVRMTEEKGRGCPVVAERSFELGAQAGEVLSMLIDRLWQRRIGSATGAADDPQILLKTRDSQGAMAREATGRVRGGATRIERAAGVYAARILIPLHLELSQHPPLRHFAGSRHASELDAASMWMSPPCSNGIDRPPIHPRRFFLTVARVGR
jgi:hypothetical protein